MHLSEHFQQQAARQFLKQGDLKRLWKVLREKNGISYHLQDDGVLGYLSNGEEVLLTHLPYPLSYYQDCYRNHHRLHVKHWRLNRPCKESLHHVHFRNGKEVVRIITKDKNTYEYIEMQYHAAAFIENRAVEYDGVRLNDVHGIGYHSEKVRFKTRLEYEMFQDVIIKEDY